MRENVKVIRAKTFSNKLSFISPTSWVAVGSSCVLCLLLYIYCQTNDNDDDDDEHACRGGAVTAAAFMAHWPYQKMAMDYRQLQPWIHGEAVTSFHLLSPCWRYIILQRRNVVNLRICLPTILRVVDIVCTIRNYTMSAINFGYLTNSLFALNVPPTWRRGFVFSLLT